jgi:hypothetical protein
MGKFIGVIAAALEQQGGEFIQTTELLDFPDEVWVYYCRPHLGAPKPGWTDLAAGTLRVSLNPPPFRHDQVEWQPGVTRDEATGAFEYMAEAFGVEPGNNVFHLALPPQALPIPGSWDVPPLYGHADESRFIIGWSIDMMNWPIFRFEPVAPEEFSGRAEEIGRAIEREARARRRQVLHPYQPAPTLDQAMLHRKLAAHFDEEGTRTLAFELGIDYDELAGRTKSGKLRELILYMRRQDQLPRLIAYLNGQYPYVLRDST